MKEKERVKWVGYLLPVPLLHPSSLKEITAFFDNVIQKGPYD